jgi:glycosyltransferase involved in cell wall biosynthesis
MTQPLVSVIIPCYKQAHYLPEAVESALAQTWPHVETIVVNDGSPDDTEAVAKQYGDRIRYVARPNGGLAAARNTGIAQARGDYFKFLDSDDYLHPEQLAWQMEALAGRQDAVSFTGCRLFRDGRPEEYLDHIPRARALLPDLFRGDYDWGGVHCYLFPRKLIEAVGGFDETITHAEDLQFFCRVGMLDPAFLPDLRIGCYYRQRAGSISANRPAMARNQARFLLELHDALRARGRRDWFGRELLWMEQGVYAALMRHGIDDPELLTGLLTRIQELQKLEGFGKGGWRFRFMARLFGYALAERIRTFMVRTFRRRPPETLDTAAWRDQT